MFSFFRQSFRQWARSGTRTGGAQKTPVRRLQCETLEDRVLPSLTGSQMLVNTTISNPDIQPATATSTNGTSVVVWTQVLPGYERDIKAQRYDANGHKIGGEITIAGTRSPQHNASVAMDSHGNFVVTWIQDYSPTDEDIHAAIFNAEGTRISGDLLVATTPKNEFDPSVAMDANGNFVVSYTYQYGPDDADIHAVMFHANGTIARTIDVAVSTRNEVNSSVSMSPDGRFAIAYAKNDTGTQEHVYVQRYTSAGVLIDTHSVADGANLEEHPDITMDSHGNTIVVWQEDVNNHWNIYARAISSAGQMSSRVTVQAIPSSQEFLPAVAFDSTTGNFVVAYEAQTGDTRSVKVTEMSVRGTQISTSTMDVNMASPVVSLGGTAHRYLLAAQSIGAKGGDFDGGVFARFGIL